MDSYEKKQLRYKFIFAIITAICIAVVISSSVTFYFVTKKYSDAGLKVSKETLTGESDDTIKAISSSLETFKSVIDQYYIGEIDDEKVLNETIKGYVKGLGDKYSEYYTKEEWAEFEESALGNYQGIGIYMSQNEDNNIVIFVNQKDMWTLFKSGQDVYDDLINLPTSASTDFVHVEFSTVSQEITLGLYYQYSETEGNLGVVYDISNGYKFRGVTQDTAESIYSSETLPYTMYAYDSTHINGSQLSYTKVEWEHNGRTISVELDIGVDSVSLIPFNSDYAIQFTDGTDSRYYTRSGYEITGTVGDSITLSNYKSLGVNVPAGVYVLENNASFTNGSETFKVKEYVYVRYNVTEDWWRDLITESEASFTYEQTYEGETAEVTDTISRGNVTESENTVTFSETITTKSGEQSTSFTYNWSFDASTDLIKYYSADSLVDSPSTNYNRYSALGFTGWDTTKTDFINHFANTAIIINYGTITVTEKDPETGTETQYTYSGTIELDVVFGELEYEIQEQ